jgi:hypothetical protein
MSVATKKRKYHEITPLQSDEDDSTSSASVDHHTQSKEITRIERVGPKKIRKLNDWDGSDGLTLKLTLLQKTNLGQQLQIPDN